jgi:hypothetical protein
MSWKKIEESKCPDKIRGVRFAIGKCHMGISIKRTAFAGAIVALSFLWIAIWGGGNASADVVPQGKTLPYQNTFFDPKPDHAWNRLYGMLFIRPAWDGKLYGADEMDPLYWPDSKYLLNQPIHQQVIQSLDQFIQSNSAHLITGPLKRALLQRMLWALFDSLAAHENDAYHPDHFDTERQEIQVRLVSIMKAVALTDDEIKSIPDNYDLEVKAKSYPIAFDPAHDTQPFLPAAFSPHSQWIDLEDTSYPEIGPIAPIHVSGVSGRSAFHVLISVPTGKSATHDYIDKINSFEPHWIYKMTRQSGTNEELLPQMNPALPQVPPLTTLALVRKANLINNKGELVNSPLTETIQLRVIRTLSNNGDTPSQIPFLFILDQTKLMKGEGGLVAQQKEPGFDMVLSKLFAISGDSLERRYGQNASPEGETLLTSCLECHSSGPGVFSMNSYAQSFSATRLRAPWLNEGDSAGSDSVIWKKRQYDWGMLQAYWFQ